MSRPRILVTGSEGLIGRALRQALTDRGCEAVGIDQRATGHERGDVRDAAALARAIAGCDGVVHLAAVSRVAWAEQDPQLCWSVNVDGLAALLDAVERRPVAPWLVFGSSREVYGNPAQLPADEDSPFDPINRYAESKVAGERLVAAARGRGLRATTVRFSNVYGRCHDHADRVVPAFARAAATGQRIVVRGADQRLDFTHVDDVTRGLVSLVQRLADGQPPPPTLHFVSGRSVTLGELAALAAGHGGHACQVTPAPPSGLHVSHFVGSPQRASQLLGWSARVPIERGLAQLVEDFRRRLAAGPPPSQSSRRGFSSQIGSVL